MIKIIKFKFPFIIHKIFYNKNKQINLQQSSFCVYNFIQSTELNIPGKYVIYNKKFLTSKINLKKELNDIYAAFDKKSTRYEINRAKKEINNITIKVNENYTEFINLSKKYYKIKYNINKNISSELNKYKKYSDLITIYYDGFLICGAYIIKDYPQRVRLLYAHSNYLENKEYRLKSSYLNKYLHWYAINKYKNEGYEEYDFGGINLDTKSETYGITKFKLSFGGDIHEEYHYLLTKYAKLLKPIYNLKYKENLIYVKKE